jgi:hypothetical protein
VLGADGGKVGVALHPYTKAPSASVQRIFSRARCGGGGTSQ